MIIYIIPLLCCLSVVSVYADQTFLVTSLGNIFLIHEQHSMHNATVSPTPHFITKMFNGFYLIGTTHNAKAINFDATYVIPSSVSQSSSSIYGVIRDVYTQNIVDNHGPYIYENGRLHLSTFGLPHVLQTIHYKIYNGTSTYYASSNHVTFGGNGTAVYALKNITHGGQNIDDFLVERICYSTPCGSITMAKSNHNLLTYTGSLQDAGLYDTIHLGSKAVRINEDYYIIADTTAGPVRLKVVEYDPNKFQIRNMPLGVAYVISTNFDIPMWPFTYKFPGCCHSPSYTMPAFKAGLQTGHSIVSYDSDSLAHKAGDRGIIQVRTYTDTLWYKGYMADYWLVFDHINNRIIKTAKSPSMLITATAYLVIPATVDTTLSDMSLNKISCSTRKISLAYLEGIIPAGQSIRIPAIPAHPILCMSSDGSPHIIPFNIIQESAQATPIRPASHNTTITSQPELIPCVSCTHDKMQSDMGGTAISSGVVMSSQDGAMEISLVGQATYSGIITRTWTSTQATSTVSFWDPQVIVRDGGSPVISWYLNGILVEFDTVQCKQISHTNDTVHSIQQGGHTIHRWSYEYAHTCEVDIDVHHVMQVKSGDTIQVTIHASPDIVVRTDDHNNNNIIDTIQQHAKISGIIVKTYG